MGDVFILLPSCSWVPAENFRFTLRPAMVKILPSISVPLLRAEVFLTEESALITHSVQCADFTAGRQERSGRRIKVSCFEAEHLKGDLLEYFAEHGQKRSIPVVSSTFWETITLDGPNGNAFLTLDSIRG